MARVKCTCRCHEAGSNMRHMVACCDNGWIDTDDGPKGDTLVTENGPIELLGLAYRHENGHLTVVPYDDPYLGDLGRQTLLLLHQHICNEFDKMKRTPPPPPKIATTDPVQVPIQYEEGHVRVMFWRDATGEHEAYEIGNYQGILSRLKFTELVKTGWEVTRLTMNGQDQGPENLAKFLRVIRGEEYPDGAKPFMGNEFRPSKN